MSLMDWDVKKFDVMVPEMNAQHEKLIGIMNKLYARADAKASKAELDRLLIDLRKFTIQHFREEEAMLDQVGFPQRDRHKSIHAKLLEDFGTHYDTFSKGPGVLSPAFFEFLRLWLTSHIMHIDRKYSEYCRQQGAA